MSKRVFLAFLICVILDIAKSSPVQQEALDGANVKTAWQESNEGSGGRDVQKTTPNPYFSCLDLGICRTNLDFCNEKKKICEKCEDYNHTCGKNIQPVGCTQYCVDLLVAKKLQEREISIPVTSEKPLESKQKSEIVDFKWILIGSIVFIIIVLSVIIGCYKYKRRQSATKENPENQKKLLGTEEETPAEETCLSYSSQQHDQSAVNAPIASAPIMSLEISDEDQTKPKMNKNLDKWLPSTNQGPGSNDLSQGQQQQADEGLAEKKNSEQIQQRAVADDSTSSGYNSASSSPNQSRSTQINKIIFNLTANIPIDVSTKTSEMKTMVGDHNENIPFGQQESGKTETAISLNDVPNKNQCKPVSDENKCPKIALTENTMDITVDKNEQQKKSVT